MSVIHRFLCPKIQNRPVTCLSGRILDISPHIKSLLGVPELAGRVWRCLLHSTINPEILLHPPIPSLVTWQRRSCGRSWQEPPWLQAWQISSQCKHGDLDQNPRRCTCLDGIETWVQKAITKDLRTPARFRLPAEVIWVENCGVGEVFWIAVNPWSVDNDHASLLQVDVGAGEVITRARHHPLDHDHSVESEGLLDDLVEEGESLDVLVIRSSPSSCFVSSIHLLLKPPLQVRVLGELVADPG